MKIEKYIVYESVNETVEQLFDKLKVKSYNFIDSNGFVLVETSDLSIYNNRFVKQFVRLKNNYYLLVITDYPVNPI